jgi:hypothetical protein
MFQFQVGEEICQFVFILVWNQANFTQCSKRQPAEKPDCGCGHSYAEHFNVGKSVYPQIFIKCITDSNVMLVDDILN